MATGDSSGDLRPPREGASAPALDHHPDRFAEAVRARLDVPVALVSLVHPAAGRQVFLGLAGELPDPYGASRQTPLSHSFCQHVVRDRAPLVVTDARTDARVRANPAVEALGVVAYAGHPVLGADSTVLGSLCAIDHQPRTWTAEELADLAALAARCSAALARSEHDSPDDGSTDPEVIERSRLLLHLSEALADTVDVQDVARVVTEASTELLGCLRAGLWLRRTGEAGGVTGPAGGSPAAAQRLCWVRQPDDGWLQAAAHDDVPLDASTPVGRAAVTAESLFLPSRAAQNDRWPHLAHERQEGERRAFLPLVGRGTLLGTLALIWPDAGPITREQERTVRALASFTGQAVERAAHRQQRTDALVSLQRSLMPTLPQTDEVELAARYLTASDENQIGGDWYDAMVRSSGCVEVTIGDVMGHDLGAAASMGQFRTMLRVLASTTEASPAASVARLDRALVDLDVAGMATLVHGRLTRAVDGDPDAWELVWVNAGHPPPVVLLPDGEVVVLEAPLGDTFVGLDADQQRSDHRRVLPAGSTLLLYTDGLVERRDDLLDTSLARLGAALAECTHRSLDDTLDGLVESLLGDRRDDDVAVLAVRLPPPGAVPRSG